MHTSETLPTTFLFVRHAQTLWNKERRYAGDSEVPLAPEADGQIAQITQRLLSEPITAIYSSPLSRCQLTVYNISQALDLEIVVRPDLKERDLGEWEGKAADELHPPTHSEAFHFPDSAYNGKFRVPGAETLEDLEHRIRGVLAQLREKHPGTTVLIATHAGVFWSIQKRIVINPPDEGHTIWPGNCCIMTVKTEGHHYLLDCIEPGL
jgi:broad specificity phosphatase PhoE